MKSKPSIAILLHEKDPYPESEFHLIWTLCRFWKEQGIEIKILKGISRHVEACLLLPHIDLTDLPTGYVDFFQQYPRVANRNLHSIAKRHISSQLLSRTDSYEGQVIVKTNLNYGGIPEETIHSMPSTILQKIKRRLGEAARKTWQRGETDDDWKNIRRMNADDYRIFPSLKEVPGGIFDNPSLVVERFLPEYEKGLYHIRIYQFVGDRGYCTRLASPRPIVKLKNVVSRQEVEIPPEVVAFREKMGMDFGKLDFVFHQGQVVVLDVNRTPGFIKPESLMKKRAAWLAPGINNLLRQSRTDGIQRYDNVSSGS